jgi:hypothetical protein
MKITLSNIIRCAGAPTLDVGPSLARWYYYYLHNSKISGTVGMILGIREV